MPFRAVKRAKVYQDIVWQFQEMILKGELRPGDRLPPERELARLFATSRTTVRQALAALQTVGLIGSRVGDGTYATADLGSFTVAHLAAALVEHRELLTDPMEVRRILEPSIAQLAAARATDEQIRDLEQQLAAQQEILAQGTSLVEADSHFHLSIARMSGNRILIKLVEALHGLLHHSRSRSLATQVGAERSVAGHRLIFEAIRDRDGERAYQAMVSHLDAVAALIAESIEPPPGH